MDFNPFSKPIRELTGRDLVSALTPISEGWYIEYKRQLPSAPAIARSIAAFANTRGGWLFYGVDAPSKSPGNPQGFPGLANSDVPEAQTKIRDSIKAHLSPVPYFELYSVSGDGEELPLGRAVIAVKVPVGPRPPYVHSSGVVFQRVADSCEPIPVRRRLELDELYKRSRASKTILKKFFSRKPADYSDQPYAQVFLLPDPYDVRQFRHSVRFERFAELMNPAPKEAGSRDEGLELPFANCQAINGAFVARQLGGMTWRFDGRGRHIINTLLPSINVPHTGDLRAFLQGYDYAEPFVDLWRSAEYRAPRIIDLTMWAVLLISAMKHVQALRVECDFKEDTGDLFCMIKLQNLGLATPFIDTPQFASHIAKFGLPMTHDGDLSIPGPDVDSLLELSRPLAEREADSYMADAGLMVLMVAGAMGLPWSEVFYHPRPADETELSAVSLPVANAVSEWTRALQRAMKVQAHRSAANKPGRR